MTPTVDLTQRLAGRVAVITGAASGIGLATARRMRAEGATIVVGDIDPKAGELYRLVSLDHSAIMELQFHEEEVIEYDSDPENAKTLKTVATTYFLSIDRLGPVEKAVLRAAGFLAPAPIPIAMFADCPDEVKALVGLWCEETGEPSAGKSVRDALTELVRYSGH